MKAQIKNIADVSCIGDTVEFTVSLDSWYRQELFDTLNAMQGDNKPYIISIDRQKRKRSLNANAYMWQMCQKIAEKVGATKETVYRKNIREVGSFETVELISAGAARFIRRWQANGLGWIAEPLSERNGYTTIIAYYGSSSYSTAEMSRLVEAVVEEAKGLGVETMTPLELDRLKAAWKGG
nr:MAG TPA: NinB protein [Caudoviricetes sp.]